MAHVLHWACAPSTACSSPAYPSVCLQGEQWKRTTVRTALAFPGFVSAIFLTLNFLVRALLHGLPPVVDPFGLFNGCCRAWVTCPAMFRPLHTSPWTLSNRRRCGASAAAVRCHSARCAPWSSSGAASPCPSASWGHILATRSPPPRCALLQFLPCIELVGWRPCDRAAAALPTGPWALPTGLPIASWSRAPMSPKQPPSPPLHPQAGPGAHQQDPPPGAGAAVVHAPRLLNPHRRHPALRRGERRAGAGGALLLLTAPGYGCLLCVLVGEPRARCTAARPRTVLLFLSAFADTSLPLPALNRVALPPLPLPPPQVFIELFFILTSMWMHQFYYLFGFLALVRCTAWEACCPRGSGAA